MAHVPQYRSVVGSPDVPSVRTRVSADASEFGGMNGRSLQGAGQAVAGVGEDFARIENHLSQVSAQKAAERTQAETMDLLTNPKGGFMTLQGDAAVQAREQTISAYDRILAKNAAGLSDHARALYGSYMDRNRTSDIGAINQHTTREATKAELSTLAALVDQSHAAVSSSSVTDDQFVTHLESAEASLRSANVRVGKNADDGVTELRSRFFMARARASIAAGDFEAAKAIAADMDARQLGGGDEINRLAQMGEEHIRQRNYAIAEGETLNTIAAAAELDNPSSVTDAYDAKVLAVKAQQKAGDLDEAAANRLIAQMERAQTSQLSRIARQWDAETAEDDRIASFQARANVEQMVIDGASAKEINDAISDAIPSCRKDDAAVLMTIKKSVARREAATAIDNSVRQWQQVVRDTVIATDALTNDENATMTSEDRLGFGIDDWSWGDLSSETQRMVVGLQADIAEYARTHKEEGVAGVSAYAKKVLAPLHEAQSMESFQRRYQPHVGMVDDGQQSQDIEGESPEDIRNSLLDWREEKINGRTYMVNPITGKARLVEGVDSNVGVGRE